MTVYFIGKDCFPTYMAESGDITSGSIAGTPLIGKTVYTWDDQSWYIVVEASGSMFYLQSYVMPALES